MSTTVQLRQAASGPVLTGTPGNAVVIGADGKSVTSAPFPAGGVSSWNGRVGAVVPLAGDYTSTLVTNLSTVAGFSVTDALNTLAAGGAISVVTNLNNGLAPQITLGNAALIANGAGTAAAWNLVTSASWVGGLREVADLAGRNAIPIANRDVGMTVYEVDTDQMWRLIGGTGNGNYVDVTIKLASNVVSGLVPAVGSVSTIAQSTGTAVAWVIPLSWDKSITFPTITQAANTTNGATAQTLAITAQSASGTTSVGGGLTFTTGTGTLAAVGTNTSPGPLTLVRGVQTVASWVTSGADFLTLGLPAGSAGAAGNSAAGTGTIRTLNKFSLRCRNNNDTTDLVPIDFGTVNGTDSLTLGANNIAGVTLNSGGGGVLIEVSGAQKISVGATIIGLNNGLMQFNGINGLIQLTYVVNTTSTGTQLDIGMRASGTTNAAGNGGTARVQGGRGGSGGLNGGGAIQLNVDDTVGNMQSMVEVRQLVNGAQRVVSLCLATDISATQMPASTAGDKVVFLANAAVNASTGPVGGLVFHAKGGNLAIFTPNASKTTIGAAGGASALPLTPTAYMPITYLGVDLAIPLFNP